MDATTRTVVAEDRVGATIITARVCPPQPAPSHHAIVGPTVRTMVGHRTHRIAAVLVLVTCSLLGCSDSDDDGEAASASPSTSQEDFGGDLPPASFEELEAIFAPLYDEVGMRLTRASMVELDGGPHLQLYVEPPGAFTTEQYVENIIPTTAAVVPFIFDTWPELASFDVCQEPPPGVDDSVAPEQVTVVALTREQAAELDWPTPDLHELISAVEGDEFGEVRGNDDVEASPAYRAARAEAG
jgi:hypothetical protein